MRFLTEVRGNLFKSRDPLVHCVSSDFRMGKGVAWHFKRKFGGVLELRNSGTRVGEVAVLRRGGRNIYYLVTKYRFFNKPTYEDLRRTLVSLKNHAISKNIKSLSMPRLGCGLDGLKWGVVKEMISEVFCDERIQISVYYL